MKTRLMMVALVLSGAPAAVWWQARATPQVAEAPTARLPGILNEGTQSSIEAPATVRVGEEFEVKITTSGGGCERVGDTSLLLAPTSATVLVYDFTTATRPGVACTMIFKQMPHTARLHFTKPGEAMIRVWGRRLGGDTPPEGVPVVIERRVTVK